MALLAACFVLASCSSARDSTEQRSIVVFNAGSLARPIRAALDAFAARERVVVEQESAGSLETARKLTELQRIPDIVAVADYEIIPMLLMPAHAAWYAQFARNRMVVAYTDQSRGANEITSSNWWQILTRPGIQVGRAEPHLDPNGYRTLLVWQLAERYYREPRLAARLAATAPQGNVRPMEAALVALVQAGELDYIWSYESLAQAANLRYVLLPPEIDLSAIEDSALYATASVSVAGKKIGDSVTVRGQPIVYGFTIPKRAPHPELALRFASFLLSADGRRILRAAKLDALEKPVLVGLDIPNILR